MKTKKFPVLAAVAVMASLLTVSCEKGTETIEPQADPTPAEKLDLTVHFQGDGLSCGTAALYHRMTGALLDSKSWKDGSDIVFTGLDGDSCMLYALGNAALEWPALASGIEGMTVTADDAEPLVSPALTWGGEPEMTVRMNSVYRKFTVRPVWEAGWDFTVSAAYTAVNPEETVPFGAWGYTVRAYPIPGQAGKDELAAFNAGEDLTLSIAGDSTRIVIEGVRTRGEGIEYDEAYMITAGSDSVTTVTFNGRGGGNTEVISREHDSRTVEFTYEDPDECPAVSSGDNHVNDICVYADGEHFTLPLEWKGVSALAGKATVRVGDEGVKKDLGSDGSIDVDPTGPSESLPIYIESTYDGSEEYFLTFTCLNKTFTVKFEAATAKKTATVQLVIKMPLALGYNDGTSSIAIGSRTFRLSEGTMAPGTGTFSEGGIEYQIMTFRKVQHECTEGETLPVDITLTVDGGWDGLVIGDASSLRVQADPWTGAYGDSGKTFRLEGKEPQATDVTEAYTRTDGCSSLFHGETEEDSVIYGITIYPL